MVLLVWQGVLMGIDLVAWVVYLFFPVTISLDVVCFIKSVDMYSHLDFLL